MKKITAILLIALLSMTALTACSNNTETTEAPESTEATTTEAEMAGEDETDAATADEVTLTYAIWDSNQETGLRTMADEFEAENPGIKIDIQVIGWSDYWTMLEAAATGGSLPDTFWMHSNEIYRYASNDMLYDLTNLIASSDEVDMANFPEGLVEIYNYEGTQLAVPKDYDTIGLWYNKTMFDEAGLEYPNETWTWDDLYEAAKALTKDDGSQYGFLAPLHNQEGYYNFVYQNGGIIITDDNVSGYDNEKTIKAIEFYVDFVTEGLSPAIFEDAERAEAMQNGLVAMGYFGSWNLTSFSENEYMAENFNVAVLPASNDGRQASIFNGLGNAIAYNTERPEAAWKWVEYLGSEEGQARQAELGVAISAYNGSSDAWVNSNDTYDISVFIDMVEYAQIRPYSNKTTEWEEKAYELLKGAFTGEKTVEAACREAADMMNKILAEE